MKFFHMLISLIGLTVYATATFHLPFGSYQPAASPSIEKPLKSFNQEIMEWFQQAATKFEEEFKKLNSLDESTHLPPLYEYIFDSGAHVDFAEGDFDGSFKKLRDAITAWFENVKQNLHGNFGDTVKAYLLLFAQILLLISPASFWGPLLSRIGFGALGPVARTIATAMQRWLGPITARSVFATLQSAAQGGYGVAHLNAAVRYGVMAWAWATNRRNESTA
ncbi:hypothetical protein F4780DRAFT_731376 [Xylariomycetidae sp. FL0641]|nr:hypothetical protein F4780DRAFT_731376 [Xylariomycetidae sp. FL0641]